MIEEQILSALQNAAISAVSASAESLLPIKAVGRTFNVPDNQKYLELVFLPNNPSGGFWGDEKHYAGIFRLILHWPNDDVGAYPPLQLLADIVSYYSKGCKLGDVVQIVDLPNLTGVLELQSENLYPASLRYSSFSQGV